MPASELRGQVPRSWLRFVPELFSTALLGLWLADKLTLFDALEYTSDLFSNTQMSLSVFMGRPLLWENGFGDHKVLHNYYLDPLFFPFTRLWGPAGLFVASALFWAAASLALFSLARRGPPSRRLLLWAVAGALLFGPVGFWFFENPIYGWHAEYLYLPLGILLACFLVRGNRASWLMAAAMVLVREEGAIVVWSIHALWEWLRPGTVLRARVVRIARVTVLWVAVFAAGMALQFVLRPAVGDSRALSALAHVTVVLSDPILRHALGQAILAAALLMVSGFVVVLASSFRAAAAALVATLPLLPPILVASCAYNDELGVRDYSISWGPRLVLLWAVLAAAVVLEVACEEHSPFSGRRRGALVVLAALISIAAQGRVLRQHRSYPLWQRATAFLPQRKQLFLSSLLRPDEDAFLRCLGSELPRDTPVSSGGSLFARFYRQEIVWPDRLQTAWVQPELVACDLERRLPYDYGCLALARRLGASGFGELRVGGISVAYVPALRERVSHCAAR